jgi:hypothetical protein
MRVFFLLEIPDMENLFPLANRRTFTKTKIARFSQKKSLFSVTIYNFCPIHANLHAQGHFSETNLSRLALITCISTDRKARWIGRITNVRITTRFTSLSDLLAPDAFEISPRYHVYH